MSQESQHPPPREPARDAARDWSSASLRVMAGFWEKAGALALPHDARGEGYGTLLRSRPVEIAYCTLFVFASSFGQTFLLSLFQPHWSAALGITTGTMGTLYGLVTLASGVFQPAVGRWLDTAPSGRASAVTLGGLFAGALLASLVANLWMLALALFTLRFFGQGMCSNVGTTRAARWFDYNRGKAVCLAVLGFPLGEALLPLCITALIAAADWRWAWVGVALFTVLVLAPVSTLLLARRRAVHGLAQPPGEERAHDPGDRRALLRDWRFYAMLVITAPVPFVGTGLIFFQGVVAAERGWGPAVLPSGFVVFAVVRALFSLSAGAWVDRIGSVRLLAAPTTLFGIGLGFLTLDAPVFAYVFYAFLGVGFGASSGVVVTAWTDLFGVEHIGMIKGLSSSVGVVATALAPIVFGWALQAGVELNALLWGSAVFMIVCAWPMCVLLVRRGRRELPPAS